MNHSDMSNMTGIPTGKKRTRRGTRGGRGKRRDMGKPHDHLSNLKSALDADDHDTARGHAFSLIRSLRQGMPKAAMPDEAEMMDSAAEERTEPPVAKSAPNPARLLAALRARRKGVA